MSKIIKKNKDMINTHEINEKSQMILKEIVGNFVLKLL